MKIQFSAENNPQKWFENIAKQFSISFDKNKIDIPTHIGDGYFHQYYICEWLTFSFFKFKMNKKLEVKRQGVGNRPLVPIIFYLNENQQKVDNQFYNVGGKETNGIYLSSSEIDSSWVFKEDRWHTFLTLTFDRTFLTEKIDIRITDTYLYKLLSEQESFYIFESFTLELLEILSRIENHIDKGVENSFLIYELSFSLFNEFTNQLNKRLNPSLQYNLHPTDIKALFHIRKQVLDKIACPPKISILAKEAGMSVSKLQKCFKEVFGKSITQYALSEKMNIAKQKIATNKYSISEIGHILGYSNLSQFSAAFKKQFGITPNQFKKSLSQLSESR